MRTRAVLMLGLVVCIGCTSGNSNLSAPESASIAVSNLPTPSLATSVIPHVVGRKLADARGALVGVGLIVMVQQKYSSNPQGTVLSISPPEGTSVATNS